MGSAKKKKRLAVAADKPTQDTQHRPISKTSKTNYFLAFLLIVAITLLYGHEGVRNFV